MKIDNELRGFIEEEGKANGWRKCKSYEILSISERLSVCLKYIKPPGNYFFCIPCHEYLSENRCQGTIE
ncbi:MAG TPA: hypothetical protein ENH82_11750 [bacterium]|nr:hypothetical protein [bacterium]